MEWYKSPEIELNYILEFTSKKIKKKKVTFKKRDNVL